MRSATSSIRPPGKSSPAYGRRTAAASPTRAPSCARAAPAAATVGGNTTIGIIATNVALSKTQATKVAQMAHDGYARTISPAHTPSDGDTIFALATGAKTGAADVGRIGELAAEAMSDAILRAVRQAQSIPGYPAARDLK